jgi:prophage antirepressor-like protein
MNGCGTKGPLAPPPRPAKSEGAELMPEIKPFHFPATGQPVRTVMVDGQPGFVAKDACDVIGISKYRDAVAQLDDDERVSMAVDTPGGQQVMTVVTEAGLYALMMISRSPRVKPFRRWVTHEVLPAIRQTGSYGMAAPQRELSRKELARYWYEAEERAELAEKRAAELEAPAEAWNVLASADADYSAREAAYILNRDPSISTGQNRLLNEMRRMRIIDSRDIPYATHERHVRLRPRTYTNRATGEEHAAKSQVRVTAEGLAYLHKKLGGTAPLQLDEEANA